MGRADCTHSAAVASARRMPLPSTLFFAIHTARTRIVPWSKQSPGSQHARAAPAHCYLADLSPLALHLASAHRLPTLSSPATGPAIMAPKKKAAAAGSSTGSRLFDLGLAYGEHVGRSDDPWSVINKKASIYGNFWGYTGKEGRARYPATVAAYNAEFPWSDGKAAPAYYVEAEEEPPPAAADELLELAFDDPAAIRSLHARCAAHTKVHWWVQISPLC